MGFVQTFTQRISTTGELFSFFWRNKHWWMLPVIFIVLVLGVVIVLAQSSAIAPFIYTLF